MIHPFAKPSQTIDSEGKKTTHGIAICATAVQMQGITVEETSEH